MNDKTRQIDTPNDGRDYGPSILRRAYRSWKMMKAFLEMELIFYEHACLDSRAIEEADNERQPSTD